MLLYKLSASVSLSDLCVQVYLCAFVGLYFVVNVAKEVLRVIRC